MRLPRIINGKCAAIIALLVGLLLALPAPRTSGSSDIFGAIPWFIAAVFTWNERVWAAILLGAITILDIVMTLPEAIRNFDTDVQELLTVVHISESMAFKVGIIAYFIGIMIIVCLLYYVAMVLANFCNEHFQKGR